MEEVQLFLHIAAAIVALGVTFSFPVIQAMAEKKGVAATRLGLEFIHRIDTVLTLPGAILVAVFGTGLIFAEDELTEDFPLWLCISITWFLVALCTGVFVQRRSYKKALATLDGVPDGADLPAEYRRISKRMQIVGTFLGLTVLGITLLMVWQPGGEDEESEDSAAAITPAVSAAPARF